MRSLPALLAFVLLLLPTSAFAQSGGSLAGRITESDTGIPLPGVHVILEQTTFGSITDANGRFLLVDLPAAPYVLRLSSLGFHTRRIDVRVSAGQPTTVRLSLDATILEIPEVIVERESLLSHPLGMDGIPGSAHRVTMASLGAFQQTDIHRALQTVPGLNIQEEDGYGLRPNIGIRGSGSERSSKISLMEDGIPVAPAPYAAPSAYYFPTVGRMQEVELRKGSSQIKYGPYTTGGALNLISTGIPDRFSGQATVRAGSNRDLTLHGHVGNSWKHGGFLVQAYDAQTDGFKQLDAGGSTGFDKTDLLAKARINTDGDARVYQALSIKLLRTSEVSDETYLGLTEADFTTNPLRRYAGSARDEMDADYRQVMLRHLFEPATGIRLTTTAYRSTFHRNWYKLDKVGGVGIADLLTAPTDYPTEYNVVSGADRVSGTPLAVKANNRNYLSRGVQASVEADLLEGLDVEAGIRIHQDEMDRFQWVDTWVFLDNALTRTTSGTPGTDSNRLEKATATAVFIQPRLIRGRFTVQPGLRFEDITIRREDWGKQDPQRAGSNLTTRENHVSVWIPGVGASARVTAASTLFGGVHRGFAPPGSTDGARPEKSVNWEVGLRHQQGTFRSEFALFYNDYTNLLGADLASSGGSGSGDQFNGGHARVRGAEASIGSNFGHRTGWRVSVPLSVTYTFTDAAFQSSFDSEFEGWGSVSDGDALPYVARHQATVSVAVEGARFDVALRTAWVSDMRTVAGTGSIPDSERVDGHVVVDVSAGYLVAGRVRAFAVIRNVTDEVYIAARRPAGVRPGLPHMALAGLTYRF